MASFKDLAAFYLKLLLFVPLLIVANCKTCEHIGNIYDSSTIAPFSCTATLSASNQLILGDFNGDGRSDWFCKNNDPSSNADDQYAITQIGGTLSSKSNAGTNNWCEADVGKLYVADLDGDGSDEIVCAYNDGSRYEMSYYKGNKFSSQRKIYMSFVCDFSTRELHIGDVNGDSRDDFLCVDKSTGTVLVHYSSARRRGKRQLSNGHDNAYQVPFQFCVGSSNVFVLADLTGDGIKDLVCNDKTTGGLTFSISSRRHGFLDPQARNIEFCKDGVFSIQDMNGDRRGDLVCLLGGGGVWTWAGSLSEMICMTNSQLYFTSTAMITTMLPSAIGSLTPEQFQYADFNGDRMSDLIYSGGSSTPSALYVAFSVCKP